MNLMISEETILEGVGLPTTDILQHRVCERNWERIMETGYVEAYHIDAYLNFLSFFD
jgi:hypothetical protein